MKVTVIVSPALAKVGLVLLVETAAVKVPSLRPEASIPVIEMLPNPLTEPVPETEFVPSEIFQVKEALASPVPEIATLVLFELLTGFVKETVGTAGAVLSKVIVEFATTGVAELLDKSVALIV